MRDTLRREWAVSGDRNGIFSYVVVFIGAREVRMVEGFAFQVPLWLVAVVLLILVLGGWKLVMFLKSLS
jgi:hypothetical protein